MKKKKTAFFHQSCNINQASVDLFLPCIVLHLKTNTKQLIDPDTIKTAWFQSHLQSLVPSEPQQPVYDYMTARYHNSYVSNSTKTIPRAN